MVNVKRLLICTAGLAASCGVIAWLYTGHNSLPDLRRHADGGFHRGECTWYVYQRAQDMGWRVRFDRPYGRHGCAWWDRVVGASHCGDPVPGGIVVFAPWPANPYGHVAFVEKVDERGRFTISHANFAVGELWQKRDGIPIYRAEFEQVPGGARVLGGRHVFALRGYLSPSTEHRAITAAQRPGEHPG